MTLAESRAYTLLANGQVIYEADTEDELWEWVAVNLPDTVFWPTHRNHDGGNCSGADGRGS